MSMVESKQANSELNTTKTEFMLIGARQRLSNLTDSPTIAIDNVQISQVATAKSLGVTIDNKQSH